MAQPAPRVKVDRTMVEQVLLNLARNGVQAMEDDTPLAERVLTPLVRVVAGAQGGRWVDYSVIDASPGIPTDVAPRPSAPTGAGRPVAAGAAKPPRLGPCWQ